MSAERAQCRRPGESRGPASLDIYKSLGPGFRRDDGMPIG